MKLIHGEALEELKKLDDESVDMVITSPPYWALRDYGVEGQLGLEPTFQEYINKLCDIFDEVKRVLKKEGTCWVVMGDTYGGSGNGAGGYSDKSTLRGYTGEKTKGREMAKESWCFEKAPKVNGPQKSLCQIPSRFAIEMTNRGWILRNEIIWFKPNCMPSSVKDRFTVDFEKMFFFVKNRKYYFEQQFEVPLTNENRPSGIVRNREYGYQGKYKINETAKFFIKKGSGGNLHLPANPKKQGRNKRCVWKIKTKPFKEAHFAVYPPSLIETPIKAGCPKGGIVLDPFLGSGTTAVVAKKLNRKWIGIELNPKYIKIAKKRIKNQPEPML